MAGRDLDLSLLIEIAAILDPSVEASFNQAITNLTAMGATASQVGDRMAALAREISPDAWTAYGHAIPTVVTGLESVADAAQRTTASLAEADREMAAEVARLEQIAYANDQAVAQSQRAAAGYASSQAGPSFNIQDLAAFEILTRSFDELQSRATSAIDAIIGKVAELGSAVLDVAGTLGKIALNSSDQLNILGTQLTAMTGNARQAADLMEFAIGKAVTTPFVDVQHSLQTMRQLVAVELDPVRWLGPIQNAAAATASSLDAVPQRIQAITVALGEIAAGATGRGLLALERMLIPVRQMGIEFSKSGSAIGSTESILNKLYAGLARFDGILEPLNRTWSGIRQNLQDLFLGTGGALSEFGKSAFQPLLDSAYQFVSFLTAHQTDIRAFASVAGDAVGSAIQQVLDIVAQGAGQITGQGTDWAAAGANLVVSLADGIIQGLNAVLEAAAVVAQAIANFLVGLSPPPVGPLSQIDKGGTNIIAAWASGIESAIPLAASSANRAASVVSNALSSLQNASGYGPNLADIFGGPNVGSLLNQAVPQVGNLLNSIHVRGFESAQAYLDGFRVGFDLSPIEKIMSTVDAILRYGVDTKQISKSQIGSYVDGVRDLLYRAALEVQEFGAITQATLSEVDASFGDLADNVERVLYLMGALAQIDQQISGAQAALEAAKQQVQAAEERVKAAEANVRAIEMQARRAETAVKAVEDKIRDLNEQQKAFELATAEIPERFTAGRKAEYAAMELQLTKEKDQRQAEVDAIRARVDAARALVEAARAQVDVARQAEQAAQAHLQALKAQQAQLKDLLRLEEQRLEALAKQAREEAAADAERTARAKKAAAEGPIRGFSEPIGSVGALSQAFENLKQKTLDWLNLVAGPKIAQLRDDFDKLKGILMGLFGLGGDGEHTNMNKAMAEGYTIGAKLRDALQQIWDNAYKIQKLGAEVWNWLVEAKTTWDNLPEPVKKLLMALVGLQVLTGIPGIVISVTLAEVAVASASALISSIVSQLAGAGLVVSVGGAGLLLASVLIIGGAIGNWGKVVADINAGNWNKFWLDIAGGTLNYKQLSDDIYKGDWYKVTLNVLDALINPGKLSKDILAGDWWKVTLDIVGISPGVWERIKADIPDWAKRILGIGGGVESLAVHTEPLPQFGLTPATGTEAYTSAFSGMSKAVLTDVATMQAGIASDLTVISNNLSQDPGTEEQKNWWQKLYDAVTGHSIVPDMSSEVQKHIKEMGDRSLEHVISFAEDASNTFRDMADTIRDLIDDLKTRFVQAFVDMTDQAFRYIEEFVREAESRLGGWIRDTISALDELATRWVTDFSSIATSTPGFLGNFDALISKFNQLRSAINDVISAYERLRTAAANAPSAPSPSASPPNPSTPGPTASTPSGGDTGAPGITPGTPSKLAAIVPTSFDAPDLVLALNNLISVTKILTGIEQSYLDRLPSVGKAAALAAGGPLIGTLQINIPGGTGPGDKVLLERLVQRGVMQGVQQALAGV